MAYKVFRRGGNVRHQADSSASYDRIIFLNSPCLERVMKCTSVLPKIIETAKRAKWSMRRCDIKDSIAYFHLSEHGI